MVDYSWSWFEREKYDMTHIIWVISYDSAPAYARKLKQPVLQLPARIQFRTKGCPNPSGNEKKMTFLYHFLLPQLMKNQNALNCSSWTKLATIDGLTVKKENNNK